MSARSKNLAVVLAAIVAFAAFRLTLLAADGEKPASAASAPAADQAPVVKSTGAEPAPATQPADSAAGKKSSGEKSTGDETVTAPATNFKPLAANTEKGLAYLIAQQDASGGWGQGGGWRQSGQNGGRVEGQDVKDPPDLGNTCIAALALIRAGNTPQEGKYAKQLARAVNFICERVEKSDDDSLYVTDVRDTQLQSKIGSFVDTFLAGLVMSELKGKMPADGTDKRLVAALDKTIKKIEKNQRADGTFAGNTGWASVLSACLCSKALNRSAQNGVAVNADVLNRDFAQTVATLDKKTGDFSSGGAIGGGVATAGTISMTGGTLLTSTKPTASAGAERPVAALPPPAAVSGPGPGRLAMAESSAGTDKSAGAETAEAKSGGAAPAVVAFAGSDAGVKLYNSTANASRISDLGNTASILERRANGVLESEKSSAEEKTKAQHDLMQVAEIKDAQQISLNAIIRQLDDKQFIAGFGNNGGEEFLSYMNIGEMLAVKGGPTWKQWDKSIAENLYRVQNKDGSWSGDHCITGRTFCTATALLTLMADRAPVPLAVKFREAQDKGRAAEKGETQPSPEKTVERAIDSAAAEK